MIRESRIHALWILIGATALLGGCREGGAAASPAPQQNPAEVSGPLEITGVIRDPDGEPISGATVVQYKLAGGTPSWAGQVVADDAGHFVLTDLEPGEYQLHGRADGFIEPSIFSPDAPRFIAGSDGIEIVMARGCRIAGRVIGPDGSRVAGVNVVLQTDTDEGANASADLSESDGSFEFSGLLPGRHRLRATDSDLNDIAEEETLEASVESPITDHVLKLRRMP